MEHPKYYKPGTISVIDAINEWKLPYALGEVITHVVRAHNKEIDRDPIKDLKTANFYLQEYIQHLISIQEDAGTMKSLSGEEKIEPPLEKKEEEQSDLNEFEQRLLAIEELLAKLMNVSNVGSIGMEA